MTSPSCNPIRSMIPAMGRCRTAGASRPPATGKTSTTRDRLDARTSPQLAVDTPRFVALGSDDMQSADVAHSGTEFDVRPAACHVCRDRHRAGESRILDDFRFTLMLLRIQHVMGNALPLQHPADRLRDLNARRAYQHRAPFLLHLLDLCDNCIILFTLRFENNVFKPEPPRLGGHPGRA